MLLEGKARVVAPGVSKRRGDTFLIKRHGDTFLIKRRGDHRRHLGKSNNVAVKDSSQK